MASPEISDPSAAHDLKVAFRDIVEEAIEQLNDARLSTPTRVLAQTVLRGLKRRGNYDDVITDVDRLTGELDEISTILQRCATALRTQEEVAANASPGSDVWWNTRTRAVVRALSLGQRERGLALLTALWVDGLAMQDWERCRKAVAWQGDFSPEMKHTLDQMREVTDALSDETYAAALDPLDDLLDAEGPNVHWIDQGAAVRLGVLRTRILIREFSDREMSRQSARTALALASDGEWSSLALAGLAEVELAADEVEAARDALAKATDRDPPPTDTLIASGLLLERDGFWAFADQSYDRAVQGDPTATRAVLLRPVPSRLLVRAAIAPGVEVRDSLVLLDRALDEGLVGEDDYPERHVQLARAELLIKLADDEQERSLATETQLHRGEAAESLVEAGQGFSQSGLMPQAVELFQRACDLAPDVAEFRWTYAEELRRDASQVDGTVNLQALETAHAHMEFGLSLRVPTDAEAWVLVTQALIAEGLSDRDRDPAVLVERALLKDPSYTVGYGFLAGILRRQGFVQEAFEASSNGREPAGASDRLVFHEQLNVLLDRGDYGEGLRLLDHQSVRQPDDSELAPRRADVLLRMQRPDEALSALSAEEPTDMVRILRGLCLFAAGDVEASRVEYWSLWNDTMSGPAGDVAGWAAYRAGMLDEAIALYSHLRLHAPVATPYTRDLGQMLLVRGEVAEGTSLLEEGIAACPYSAELKRLATDEFDFIRHATADAPHGAQVANTLESLGQRIERRCSELLHSRRPDGAEAALLGAARVAMHAARPLDALVIYRDLVGSAGVPEALDAAIRAGWSASEAADVLFAQNDHDEARSLWSAAESSVAHLPADADLGLLQSLVCRRMLADLVDGSQDGVAAWLGEVSGDVGLEDAMIDAARTLSYDVVHIWALRDGLLALRDRVDVDADERRLVVTAADRLPFSRAYHLDAGAAQTLVSTLLFLNPLELRCGPGVEELCHSDELATATSELQMRIEDKMGVRIPWVYAVAAPRLADRQVDVRVHGRRVGSVVLAEERGTWIPQVMAELEDRVNGDLFRLLDVDDVDLWLEGWDPSAGHASTWDPTDPRADRLRLVRVLRMLLREHVSVSDRGTIVEAVRSPAGVDKRHESATLDTLLRVRKRLGKAALGVKGDTVVIPLPAELEYKVAAGLPADRPVWELPRTGAHGLLADLRAWLRAQPVTPAAISVADSRVRPFVWRLLAAEKPAVRVLSEEELS
ncbi:MAG: FHIPEP family type III secretion protein [Actinomycetota bacterium]